jgi:hypothetical protein
MSVPIVARRQLIGRSPSGEHEHASVVLMAFPGIEQIEAGAALAAERRECSFALRVLVIECGQPAGVPPDLVVASRAVHRRLCRGQPNPPWVHVEVSPFACCLCHGSGTLITARLFSPVGMIRSLLALGCSGGQKLISPLL